MTKQGVPPVRFLCFCVAHSACFTCRQEFEACRPAHPVEYMHAPKPQRHGCACVSIQMSLRALRVGPAHVHVFADLCMHVGKRSRPRLWRVDPEPTARVKHVGSRDTATTCAILLATIGPQGVGSQARLGLCCKKLVELSTCLATKNPSLPQHWLCLRGMDWAQTACLTVYEDLPFLSYCVFLGARARISYARWYMRMHTTGVDVCMHVGPEHLHGRWRTCVNVENAVCT